MTVECAVCEQCFLYQELLDVHLKKNHRVPSPRSYITRMDGRLEAICVHGISHTIDAPEKYKKLAKRWALHECDGCCIGWGKE